MRATGPLPTIPRHHLGMPSQRAGPTELDDVAERLGSPLRTAEPVGWGTARATHRLSLADGRFFAARRFAGPGRGADAQRVGRMMARLGRAGLPIPTPTVVETLEGQWLLTPWIEGETGATWLGDADRARHLAERMGKLASRLRSVELDADQVEGPGTDRPHSATPGARAFVHGDFAPINVVIGADGEIGALLDFEHAGEGPALLDVAWWGWVVRHHHPEGWAAAWPTFLAAAGLEPGDVEVRLHELALKTLADRVAASRDSAERDRWRQRLATARAWAVPGDQAT
jgi:aminoglycoside phosphotransferase (APT) family kinase protein